MTKQEKLYKFVSDFVKEHEISCSESIYQRDSLQEESSEFMEKCVEIVGYFDSENSPQDKTIPKTLDDAVDYLYSQIDDETINKIKSLSEDEFVGRNHFFAGMGLRNNWNLWGGSVLSKHFNKLGIRHPDDMSGIVHTSLYRKTVGKDRDLEGQIKRYKDYWAKNPLF